MSPIPTVCSSSDADFLEFFVSTYGCEKLSHDEADFLMVLNQLDCSPFSQIQAFKDFGNNLYRQREFDQAGACYDTACRFLSSSLKAKIEFDFNPTLTLAVSLCLNLAACANKLRAFEEALIFCSMVLTFFPRNAKALFRKGVALRNLNRFSEANSTLEEASLIEPNNKDIFHELEAVRQSLAINKNGKRIVVDSLDAYEVRAGKTFVSSLPRQEVVSPLQHQAAGRESKMTDDASSASLGETARTGEDSMLNEALSEEQESVRVSVSSDVTMEDTDVCNSSSSTTSSSRFHFTNKRRPHNNLHLSSQAYDDLLHGKNLGFYHPRSMSFMRVRTLTSKTIQTGTPHADIHGTAEVPNSSPTPENFYTPIDIELTDSAELVQEEATLQAAKKTRFNSDSPCASKISSVQFTFAAVTNHLPTKADRVLVRCRPKSRKARVYATSKKRSLVPVDVSVSLCRYTRFTTTITRMKRKDIELIDFDTHFHPPFKKCRLFSSVATTCTVSSVAWFSNSLGVTNAPAFVV